MTLAIMQPYFLPYLGYWQLLSAVDRFVVYDDVNYIQRGWINRNRILINGAPAYLTIPLSGASQNRRICELSIAEGLPWREKMLRSIATAYRRFPCFEEIYPALEQVVRCDSVNLSDYLQRQLGTLCKLLGITTEIVPGSRRYGNDGLAGQERIIDICRHEAADVYINLEGGRALYDADAFAQNGIELRFVRMNPLEYPQKADPFQPNLSIVDVLMANGLAVTRRLLTAYSLD